LEFAILKVLLSTRLPLHAYSILFAQPKLFNLPKCFSTLLEANNLQGAKVLQIHSSLVVLVGLCEHFGAGPLHVWATHEFYGKPYFNDIYY
jgi:NADH:ubiquinone oxidoreductase subunit 2 (subunit N)